MNVSDDFSNAQKYFKIALDLQNNEELDEALKYYYKALKILPNYSDALSNIGNIFWAKKMYNKAIAFQKKAIFYNKNHFLALYNLGAMYMQTEEFDRALYAYKSALQINNLSNDFLHVLLHYIGVCYYEGFNDLENAIKYCEKSLELNPFDMLTIDMLELYMKKLTVNVSYDNSIFIDCNKKSETMKEYMIEVLKKLRKRNILNDVKMSYNLLTSDIFDDSGMKFMSVANVGKTTSTAGFNIKLYKDKILNNDEVYLCYIAVPVDQDDNVIEDETFIDLLCDELEEIVESHVSSIGAISFNNYPRCKTMKWIYELKNPNDNFLNHIDKLKFISLNHIRYENGFDHYGLQVGAKRGIEIIKSDSNENNFIVTMYNLDGNHPIWGTNIQMHPKRMKIISQSATKVELRGFGNDKLGIPFSGYGLSLYFDAGEIERIVLHMFDKNVDIEYFK